MSPTNVQTVPNKVVIVACPVSTCEIRQVAGVGVLVAIRYIERSEQFETGEHTILQALLAPEQALEIGEALRKSVQVLELGNALKKAVKKTPLKRPVQESAMLLPAPVADEPVIADAVCA